MSSFTATVLVLDRWDMLVALQLPRTRNSSGAHHGFCYQRKGLAKCSSRLLVVRPEWADILARPESFEVS